MQAERNTKQFIVFISEAPPTFMAVAVKVVQAERNTKQIAFIFISEAQLTFMAVAVKVQAEDAAKKKSKNFSICSIWLPAASAVTGVKAQAEDKTGKEWLFFVSGRAAAPSRTMRCTRGRPLPSYVRPD